HVLRTFTEGVLRAYSNAEGFLPVHAEVAFHCTAPLVDGYCAYGACVPAESATNTLPLEDDYGPIDFRYGILRTYVKAGGSLRGTVHAENRNTIYDPYGVSGADPFTAHALVTEFRA